MTSDRIPAVLIRKDGFGISVERVLNAAIEALNETANGTAGLNDDAWFDKLDITIADLTTMKDAIER